jgi:hypothetical protein
MRADERLQIDTHWERLERGAPEERATFAALGIHVGDRWLTEAEDLFVGRTRREVHLSAYRLAEWFTWNWWRLRWEPFRQSESWNLAHKMATIGGGYVWPNVTIVTDGERVILDPIPSEPRPSEPLRYLSSIPLLVSADSFEAGVETFVRRVIEQLRSSSVDRTNLNDLWESLSAERTDAKLFRFRKLEALLGWDPGEASDALIERLQEEAADLGADAIEELAANGIGEQVPIDRAGLVAIAAIDGIDANPRDAASLGTRRQELPHEAPAWLRGARAAQMLREQENLGDNPLSDDRLCELSGVARGATAPHAARAPLSFELDDSAVRGTVVLRSRHNNARRFDLARILGDRNLEQTAERLRPVTRSRTYRQKAQRAFAAEFLCPIEPLIVFLDNDLSEEAYEEAGSYFHVSEQTVKLQLLNNHVLRHEDVAGELLYTSDNLDRRIIAA